MWAHPAVVRLREACFYKRYGSRTSTPVCARPFRGSRGNTPRMWTGNRSEEHTSELQSPCNSYAVFCLKKKRQHLRRRGVRSPVAENQAHVLAQEQESERARPPGRLHQPAYFFFSTIRAQPRSQLFPNTTQLL